MALFFVVQDEDTETPALQLSPEANRGLRKVRAFKPTPTTPCGVILTSKGEDGVARVRRLEHDSFLRAAGVGECDLLLDVDGATGGATAIAQALRAAYGEIELLIKPQQFPRVCKDPPAWPVELPKADASQSLDSLMTLLSTRPAVVEVHGAASSLDILPGDLLLCVDNQPVQNVEQARRIWERAADARSVRMIFEAGPERLARLTATEENNSPGTLPAGAADAADGDG